MLYLFCEFKKQNTFRIYWICSIFLFFRPIVKKNLWKTCLFYQTKSRFYLELDSKIQASKDILKEKEHRKYVLDETIIKAGSEYIWLWVAIEPKNKEILGISISKERNMFVAERFLSKIVEKYGDHPVSTDGGTWYLSTSVQVFKYGSSHSLPIWKKYRRKDHTIHQGQNWMFWRLLSMQKKEM